MKRIMFLFSLFFSVILLAQEKLSVKYEYHLEMEFDEFMKDRGQMRLPPEMQKKVLESITEPRYYTLHLSPGESLYTNEVKINNSQSADGRQGSHVVRGANPLYKNLNENYYMQTKVMANKDFLVKDSLIRYDWKITKETKEILGYEVRKAEYRDSSKIITAWYAPKLPFKSGPEYFQGLPGLIFDVVTENYGKDVQKSKYIWKVLSVEVDKSNSALEKPTKGKPASETEFKQFVEQQQKKNREMYEGGVDKD